MTHREYIAYKGGHFIIEWYYTESGNSPALEYYNSLDKKERIKFLYLLKRMGDAGKISDKTKLITKTIRYTPLNRSLKGFCVFSLKRVKLF